MILFSLFFLATAIIFHFKIEDLFLKYYGQCTHAVVIAEKESHRGGGPTYRFRFVVDEQTYKGDSWIYDESKISDTISIVYLKGIPQINRSIGGYFLNDFDCR